jgi:hypothetical protein
MNEQELLATAKRRLTDITFQHEGAHVALVGKHQGSAANGHSTLITKGKGVDIEAFTKELAELIERDKPERYEEIVKAYEETNQTGITVTKSMLDKPAAPTSAEITMQILKAKYN